MLLAGIELHRALVMAILIHRHYKPIYYGIIIVCVISTFAGQAQTKTLSECISMGINNNLTLNNALTSIKKGQIAVTQNRSRLLPVIQGMAQFTDYLKSPVNVTTGTLLGNDFPDEPTWQTIKSMQYNTQAGILMTVPIFNKSIFAGIDVAKTALRRSGLPPLQ